MTTFSVNVRFATNRDKVTGAGLFGKGFRDGNPKHYVTGSIEVVRQSSLPDKGWFPDPATLHIDAPSPPLAKVVATQDPNTTPATAMLKFANARQQAHVTTGEAAGF